MIDVFGDGVAAPGDTWGPATKETSRSRRVGISFDDLGQGDARQGRPGLLEGQGLWPAPWKRMAW